MGVKANADELTFENLTNWTSRYPGLEATVNTRKIGVVMAGNIPLVGFHDFLSVLISGNTIIAKTSSKDPDLVVFIGNILGEINPEFKKRINFTDGLLSGFDAVIATGSDNSSRYFEYYFGRYPHIIRKNRNSIAILDGSETRDELSGLGSDVFSYFGLGCRSVSKIFLPVGYDMAKLKKSWAEYEKVIYNNKYANNYDYNKAIFIVNKNEFTDTGFLLLRRNSAISSPVSVLYYEYYETINNVYLEIEMMRDKIQCIVSRNEIHYGRAQWPSLWDYADGIDTVDFLLKKN